MYCFNYEHDGWSKHFLQKCLENGSKNIVKAGINLLQLLFRNEITDFQKWGIDFLLANLFSEEEISVKALQIIEEIAQNPEYMHILIKKWPKLLNLGNKAENFLISILSVKEGFSYLINNN
eukprot:TRINITY_DN14020_c0_g1_i1.p2 TRINITY_DN14020_c0_g1~~TRINITY_DN14020_c0_g1_i1.p2  ORF type:complete len:121 (-),score=24.24 TRINITY_DN14020_c0_g1_i1:329-691(-)